jgi:hypothetical protein
MPIDSAIYQLINLLAGKNVVAVGHDLLSCTENITPITIPYPSGKNPRRRLVILDTPGFDDTFEDDTVILEKIASWLDRSCECHYIIFCIEPTLI